MIPISIERGDRKLKMLQISMSAARVNANMTQDDIAREMHISKQTVINWEKGRITPNIAQFEMYCRLCGISKDNIFLPEKAT
jgi:DNA-binding XRE family transcriptional regulator